MTTPLPPLPESAYPPGAMPVAVRLAAEYPLADEGWSVPEQHTCEATENGVLCMETATGAIYSGWTDYVWFCQPHLDAVVKDGWERVDFSEDDDDA